LVRGHEIDTLVTLRTKPKEAVPVFPKAAKVLGGTLLKWQFQEEFEMALTVEDLMEKMPGAFIPEKAEGVDAVIQFNLGAEGGDWVVTIRDQKCVVERGTTDSPNLTLTAEAPDYIDMITGKLNPMTAIATKKIVLKGDLNLAMKYMNLFKL
jgi:putative sterol carrier protein